MVWLGRWSRGHNNVRYSALFSRLERLEVKRVPPFAWRPFESLYYRLNRPVEASPLWPVLLGYLSRQYRYLLCTTSELHHVCHFDGTIIVDDDDPVFTSAHLAQLNHPNVKVVVTTTELLRNRLVKEGLQKLCVVIPSGVDFSTLDSRRIESIRSQLRNGESGLVVGFAVPRLYTDDDRVPSQSEKRLRSITFLCRVMEKAWEEQADIRVWLMGKPSESVVRYANEHPQVKLLGYIPHHDVLNYYANFDIAVYPRSIDLGGRHSIKLLEYMACGVPVVSTNVAEAFLIRNSGAGLISTGVGDFAENLIHLAKDVKLRKRLGQKGKEFARPFDWDVVAKRYEREVFDVFLQ